MRKETENVILAGIDFAKVCETIEEKYDIEFGMEDYNLRFEDKYYSLSDLSCEEDVEEVFQWSNEAKCTVQELTDEEFMDGAIICEGTLYEVLFYYESGSFAYYDEESTKELYKELSNILEKHGFQLDLSRPGTILLQSKENIEKQLKREFEN